MPLATAQCATASIITLFLCPFVVAFFDRQMRKKNWVFIRRKVGRVKEWRPKKVPQPKLRAFLR
ncbi:hypothetical protein P7L88_03965 [Bisgaard Taxon 10/6]|uniref:hypothetical protein n=1 Tax=Exercitatus varius TaxID=67857 RepID=UPI00294B167F|nr:hypothetical protein [Exercitatus varius]MDG2947684.1 hypothetical protein [Exercitatus varius]